MSAFPVLQTGRLMLRELTANDAPALFDIHHDADTMRWSGVEPLSGIDEAKAVIAMFAGWRRMPDPGTRWAIERKSDERLLGTCGLFAWNRESQTCATGYELASDVWGNGYMTEALSSIIPWGFAQMQLNRIEAQVHPQNAASVKLVKSLGFKRERLLRQVICWSGQPQDLLQFSLLRSAYCPRMRIHESTQGLR